MRLWLFGFLLGTAFVVAAGVADTSCSSVTEPPPNWPKDPTCAQDPSQPWCYHPPQAERADAGR